MTSIALTPNASTAMVAVAVTGLPAGSVTLTRVDTNGAAPLRLRTGQVPISGAITVTDFEAALTGPIRYDVVDSAGVTTSATTTLGLVAAGPRIAKVQLPQEVATPTMVTGYEATRGSSTPVHWPEGRPDPVVILRPARTRTGRLSALATSYADAVAMLSTIAAGAFLHLRQTDHAGMDMYFAVTESTLMPLELLAGGWYWTVQADYTEVKSPNVPLLGSAGWTYADMAATFPSYSAARSSFATYGDLIIGPTP